MFTTTEIVNAANQFFPNNYGVLITGSQQTDTVLKKETDIDIIVFDILVSNQFGLIAQKDGYKIDFIVMPITDIVNVMDNSLHEPKNGLLHLMQATVLSDPYNIIKPILEKAKQLFNKVQYRTQLEYSRFMIELMKLRKLFTTTLTPSEKTVLLSDFVSIITLLETIRVTNWSSKTKHKLRNLNEKSPQFLQKIETLFQQGLKSEYNEIIAYINFYEKSYLLSHLPINKKYQTLVAEVSYHNFSITHFVNNVLPQILQNEILANSYCYFYLSPNKYKNKYLHNISIVFKIGSEENGLQLIENIHSQIKSIDVPGIYTEHFCEPEKYVLFDDDLIKLKNELSKLCKASIVSNNDFVADEMLNAFFILIFYAKQKLGIGNQDFVNINSFIAQKWLFTKAEQEKAESYPALINVRSANMKRANDCYTTYMPQLLQMVMQNEVIINTQLENSCNCINTICDTINTYALDETDIYYTIIAATKVANPKIITIYKLMVEEMLLALNLSDTDKYNALFSCSKAITELGVEQPLHTTPISMLN